MKIGLQVFQVLLLIALCVLVLCDRDQDAPSESSSSKEQGDPGLQKGIDELQIAVGRLEEKVPADLR